MANQNNINVSVLDNLIIGRVEPHIYAFSTETVPNYIKIGDTYRPIETRLNEWRKYFPNLEKQFAEIAKVDEETFYRDFAIHYFLENELKKERLDKKTIKNLPYFSNEFFKNATNKDIKDAIKDIKNNHDKNNHKYQYYKFDASRIPITHTYARTENYNPRPNQQETIDKFNIALKKGRKNLLMYAVMRFGKSFTSMCCATEMKAKVVVIVTAKADVKEEWKRTVESHIRFSEYEFADSNTLLQDEKVIKKKVKEGKRIVLFLTLQDLQGEEVKQKHKEVFKTTFDLLIVDETHFGARASEYGKVLLDSGLKDNQIKNEQKKNDNSIEILEKSTEKYTKELKPDVRIHLSGTPYRILMGSEFTDDDIIAFYQFSDIANDQEAWDKENINKDEIKEWDNPYYGFPQMIRFAFNPNESSRKKMEELKKHGVTYAFSSLFKPKSISKDNANQNHKRFEHENEIIDLLEVIDGSKKDENLLGFLDYEKIKDGNMCRHIVCVLPYRASCDAFENLIKINKKKFKNLNSYEIINIAGVDNDRQNKETQTVKAKIKECESENKKTLTLTVNRMLTGSTVEEWDTMLYLKDTASPQEYDQAVFRLQNQYIRKYTEPSGDVVKFNMKPQTLLVDFDPNRMFSMQEQKSQIYNVNTEANGNSKLEERIKRELEISPIIILNKNKIVQVIPTDVLDAVRKYSSERSVLDEATTIPVDFSLINIDEIKAEIEKQGKIGSKQGLEIKPAEGDGEDTEVPSDGDDDDDTNTTDTGSKDKDSDSNANEEADFRSKFAMYYAKILFFAFLTESKIKSLTEIIKELDKGLDNKRITASLDLNKTILDLLQNNMNPFILSKLDYKIFNINTLANDKTLEPIQRASNALKKFSRLSMSEVVTPENITDEIINILPSKDINKKTKILDIAAKQGEFVYSVYKKYGKEIANNFYSIPTSKIAYEFTRKVYNLLELNNSNIVKDYTTYDLLKQTDIIKTNKIKIGDTFMKFDVVVGNPPYQENIGGKSNKSLSKQLYPSFMMFTINLQPDYLSLITPSRWFTGNAQDRSFVSLREFMRNNNHITDIVNYLSSGDVFKDVSVPGGVNFFLYKKGYSGNISFREISKNNSTVVKRPLFENGLDIILPMNSMISILRKVNNNNFKSMEEIVTGRNPFGLPATDSDLEIVMSNSKNANYDTKILCAYEQIKFISKNEITRNKELAKHWKVFTSKMNGGAGNLQDEKSVAILGRTFVMGPDTICSNAILAIGDFKNKYEAENLQKYMKTKFFRFMLGIKKIAQVLTSNIYQYVPQQDFSNKSDIDWNKSIENIDQQLYKKYKLMQDEIEIIESKIKVME